MRADSLPLNRAQILVIEENPELAAEISAELQRRGYPVRLADSIAEGLDAARAGGLGVMILDPSPSGLDCLSLADTLREEGARTPVLVISTFSSIEARLRGLNAGGDDYRAAPLAMAELAARVEAVTRRLDDLRATRLRAGDLEMDLIERTVRRGEVEIELLPRAFRLLEYFLRRPGQIVTRAMLLEGVWRYRFTPETNVVDVHIGALRRKIDIAGRPTLIANIRGAGFMLKAEP